ncbi:hypothetical protein HK405_005504 [Cladochytrium tenue]|nr:hypothetical protein HK405_005504 [Cladochytrium tenue]
MASQGYYYKTEYPAAVSIQPPGAHDDLLSARHSRRAAVLLAVGAALAFATPFVPDHFWTYRTSGGEQGTEFLANVYSVNCLPMGQNVQCLRDTGACYYYSLNGSVPFCRVTYAQLFFAAVAFVSGITAVAITGKDSPGLVDFNRAIRYHIL